MRDNGPQSAVPPVAFSTQKRGSGDSTSHARSCQLHWDVWLRWFPRRLRKVERPNVVQGPNATCSGRRKASRIRLKRLVCLPVEHCAAYCRSLRTLQAPQPLCRGSTGMACQRPSLLRGMHDGSLVLALGLDCSATVLHARTGTTRRCGSLDDVPASLYSDRRCKQGWCCDSGT